MIGKIRLSGMRRMTRGLLLAGIVVIGSLTGGIAVEAAESAKAELLEAIAEAGAFAEAEYSIVSWGALRAAMNEAREIANKPDATAAEIGAAYARMREKIDSMEEREILAETGPRIALSASLVATDREGPVNNVALRWGAADDWDVFEIYRRSGSDGEPTRIYRGRGVSFHDYGLAEGAYEYRLVARREDGNSLRSNVVEIATMALPAGLEEHSNETGTGAMIGRPLKIGDTYYRFDSTLEEGRRVRHFVVMTSSDGTNWEEGPIVLDQSSHPDMEDCKLEALNFVYNEKNDRIVFWAHWEVSGSSYAHGRAIVASAKPGEPFTVHHVYTPLGVQVRDMSVFIDDDKQGYLVAASNVPGQGANSTLYIFELNDDYTDVTGIANKLLEGRHREAPHIIKSDGFYYVFFSQSAGWYPSQAGYLSAESIHGRWSNLRAIANTSTFSAQSGGLTDFGREAFVPVYLPNRWVRGEGTARQLKIPLHLVDGFAFGDYSPTLLVDAENDLLLPLHSGRLLSQDRPAVSSIAGMADHGVEKAFDGDYYTFFRSDDRTWPFTVTSDLGELSRIRNVQISWHIHNGSEGYYKYTIEGSADGEKWQVLLDRTDDSDTVVSRTYGFTSDLIADAAAVRYVRLNVQQAVLHNNPNNWYPPTLYQVKVYGDPAPR